MTNSDGTTVVTARGGGGGDAYGYGADGGSGWSGGGGYGGGAGGYNGGDGQDGKYSGGSGQQTALPTIPGVTIVPGAGGMSCSGSGCWGGGGGGIIINGEGTRDDRVSQSQGYGAGGGRYGGSSGLSGAVIIYV